MAVKPTGVYGRPGTGFVEESDGPFECGTCIHMVDGHCDHPRLDGREVDEGDCCSFWWPAKNPPAAMREPGEGGAEELAAKPRFGGANG